MATLTYPAALPVPQAAPIQSVERRFLPPGGPWVARVAQHDRLDVQRVTFPPFTGEQALAFDEWWTTTLRRGGAWFAATWPLPRGWVTVSRRFIGTPRWQFIPGGFWRITADFEVRGRSELPIGYNPITWEFNEGVCGFPPFVESVPWTLSFGDQQVDVPDPAGVGAGTIFRQGSIIATRPQTTGRRYFEIAITGNLEHPPYGMSPTQNSWGIVRSDFVVGNSTTALGGLGTWGFVGVGDLPGRSGIYVGDDGAGSITSIPGLAPITDTTIFGFAVDLDARKAWFSIDGNWITGEPSLDLTPTASGMSAPPYTPCFCAQRALSGALLRTIPPDFASAAPSGFTYWADD